MTHSYQHAMPKLLAGQTLSRDEARALMADIMVGDVSHPRIAAVLTALAMRGEHADELAGFATVMRERARRVPFTRQAGVPLLDTCGTGGSGLDTANTSTMAAFVLAAAGVTVAKHGNRSSSGRCGSMDVLEAMGVRIEVGPEEAAGLLATQGVAFLFAPLFHPAVGFVMPVRRDLGFRTVFNFLGPLCNPAMATHQVLGVSDPTHAERMAHALCELGSERVMVVHGSDGLDELTLQGPSRVWHVTRGEVQATEITPESVGLDRRPLRDFAGGGPAENAAIFEAVLRGDEVREGAAHGAHVALNAAAGLLVCGSVTSLEEGVVAARDILASGAAWERFVALRQACASADGGVA